MKIQRIIYFIIIVFVIFVIHVSLISHLDQHQPLASIFIRGNELRMFQIYRQIKNIHASSAKSHEDEILSFVSECKHLNKVRLVFTQCDNFQVIFSDPDRGYESGKYYAILAEPQLRSARLARFLFGSVFELYLFQANNYWSGATGLVK